MEALRASLEKATRRALRPQVSRLGPQRRHAASASKQPRQALTQSGQALAAGDHDAFLQHAGRGTGPAAARAAPCRDSCGRLRPSRARTAAAVSLLVPGPDHPARRPRARAGQHSAPRIRRSLGSFGSVCRRPCPCQASPSARSATASWCVREPSHWQADDGQYLLGLDVSVHNGMLRVIEHRRQRAAEPAPAAAVDDAPDAVNRPVSTYELFGEAMRLESIDDAGAVDAYASAAEPDPRNAAAWINWGRLLHEQGEARAAERVYRRALEHCAAELAAALQPGGSARGSR